MDLVGRLRRTKRELYATARKPPTPSFAYKLAELERSRRAAMSHYMTLSDKAEGKEFAAGLDVRTPRILATCPAADAVPWDELPDELVVKPRRGAGSLGVYLLRRAGTGFTDIVTGRPITPDDIAGDIARLAASKGSHSEEVVVEELLRSSDGHDRAPDDWKFYMFRGELGLILQRRQLRGRSPSLRFYDPHWRPLGNIRAQTHIDRSLDPPVHREELRETATRLSLAVPAPFVRIDLFDTPDGAVFGEITAVPGGPQWFRRRWDRALGELWEDAETRMRLEEGRAAARD